MIDKRNIDSADRQMLSQKIAQEIDLKSEIAILGDGTGRIYVTGRPGYVWVRKEQTISETGAPISTAPFPVRHNPNAIYKVSDGTRVRLFFDRDGQLAIEGGDFESIVATGGNPAIYNPLNPFNKFINPSQFTPLLSHAIATSGSPTLKVAVRELLYITEGNTYNFFAGEQYDFTGDVPATSGKKVLALLYLQNNTVSCVTGTEVDSLVGWGAADIAEVIGLVPSGGLPIAIWVLTNGMTTIGEKQFFLDLRQWLNIPNADTDTFPMVLTKSITIPAGRQKVIGRTVIDTGGELIVQGRVRVV